jgi:hypothetical protein
MLKGYLLANIDEAKRAVANSRWRNQIRELNDAGKEVEADCLKAWLRSQFSTKIRERKRGAKAKDFDRIGTEFHRWLRDAADSIGLHKSDDFYRFIDRDFDFYSRKYLQLLKASQELVPGMEHVLYNEQYGFTLQYMLLLAPLQPDDSEAASLRKIGLVAHYLDILLTWRLWNFPQHRLLDHAILYVPGNARHSRSRARRPCPQAPRISGHGDRNICQQ